MAAVRDLKVDSANDYATVTIVITREWSSRRPQASDLPKDARDALKKWLAES